MIEGKLSPTLLKRQLLQLQWNESGWACRATTRAMYDM